MKTLTVRSLLTAAELCVSFVQGDLTGYSSGGGTSTSLVVPGYSSAFVPSFVPFTSPTTDLAQTTAGIILPSLTTDYPQTTAGIILSSFESTITPSGVSSVTNPANFSSFSTGKIRTFPYRSQILTLVGTNPSGSLTSLNTTVLSFSLTYTRTSSSDISSSKGVPSYTINSVVPSTTTSVPTTLSTSILGLSSSLDSTSLLSKTTGLPTSHFFSWTGQTTFTTSTISLYTNPFLGTSGTGAGISTGTGVALQPSANSTLSYAWPTLSDTSEMKTQQRDVNTIPWQLFTPPAEIKARHIDGDSQDFTPCTTESIFAMVPGQ